MAQEVLDFDCDVVCHARKAFVQASNDCHPVARTVKEIRVSEGDVFRACLDLLCDILDDNVALHDSKRTVIHRHHRTMPAAVLASGFFLGGIEYWYVSSG